jgi:hypothetical protein
VGLEKRDAEMMCVSIPVVDYWEMREDLDRLEDMVNRLEKVLEALFLLYKEERVKNWEMILQAMVNEKKGMRDGNRVG